MAFEDHLRLDGRSPGEQALRFLVGVSPAMQRMS